MSIGIHTKQSNIDHLDELKTKLLHLAALGGMTALMWLGEDESSARYLTASDWAEIRAVAEEAK